MRFCDECGSRMKATKRGYSCPKCGTLVPAKTGLIEVKRANLTDPEPIYVIESEGREATKVSRTCPQCGNDQSFHWFSSISGEHAGVRQERTVGHFRCTTCLHSWAETR